MCGQSTAIVTIAEKLLLLIFSRSIGYLLHPTLVASLPENARIADLGTGTGIWLKEMAEQSPSTYRFDGFDISDAQFLPKESLPSNVTLALGDFKKPIPEELRGQYDLITIRLIIIAMGKGVWETTLRNVLALLKPGGAIQWIEGDFMTSRGLRGASPSSTGGHYLTKAQRQMNDILVGRFNYNFPDFVQLFEGAGLTGIHEEVQSTDRLPEQRPDFTEIAIGAVLGALKNLARVKAEGYWSEEEVEENRRKALEDRASGAYMRWDIHVCFGYTAR